MNRRTCLASIVAALPAWPILRNPMRPEPTITGIGRGSAIGTSHLGLTIEHDAKAALFRGVMQIGRAGANINALNPHRGNCNQGNPKGRGRD